MNHNIVYCRVKGCRFAWSHLTCAHLCGTCGQKGHGQVECGKESLMARLRNISTLDTLPYHIHCHVQSCPDRSTHCISAHVCHVCHGLHAETDCTVERPRGRLNIRVRDRSSSPSQGSRSRPHLSSSPFPENLPVPRQISPRPLDNVAPETPQMPIVPQLFIVNCPICRKANRIPSDQTRVSGVENRCVICWDKNSEIFMPTCGHVCLCYECIETLHQANHAATDSTSNIFEFHPSTNARHRAVIENLMGQEEGSIYVIIPAGMGCMWYFKRNGVGQPIDEFFMHSDNWGQYGSQTDHRSQLNAFIDGFRFHDYRST